MLGAFSAILRVLGRLGKTLRARTQTRRARSVETRGRRNTGSASDNGAFPIAEDRTLVITATP
jgi:hypothetical protein